MKYPQSNINKRRIKRISLFLAALMIILGGCIAAENVMKFAHANSRIIIGDQIDISGSTASTEETDIPEIADKDRMTDKINLEKNSVLYTERPKAGDVIGELYIPKLNATLPIYEGTGEDELDLGVGHFADSVLPGEKDNSVLAGHRDTVFQKLGEVGLGDLLIVRTSIGEFEYKVDKVRIVDKSDRTVIVPKPSATLTVSTCYPFSYIGSAPERYILVAYLASQTIYE